MLFLSLMFTFDKDTSRRKQDARKRKKRVGTKGYTFSFGPANGGAK